MYVDPATGQGVVAADVKSFRSQHPSDANKEIWYASLEGPEAAAYVRGTTKLMDGTAVITLPEHFVAVANPEGTTVQLTPRSAQSRGLAVVEQSSDRVVIRELGGGTGSYEFDFLVMSVRKGFENFEVIRDKGDPSTGPAH
jgi:hypothetical protein